MKKWLFAALLIPAAIMAEELPDDDLQIPELDLPAPIQDDIDAYMEARRPILNVIQDLRSFSFEKLTPEMLAKWRSVYASAEYLEYKIEFVELERGLRIINEIQAPPDGDLTVLKERLALYKKRGYNAVLVAFTTTENFEQLLAAVREAKAEGFKIIFAYSAGRENLNDPVFRDPEIIADWVTKLGKESDAILLGWRRTSPHLFLQDKVYRNFLIKNARKENPKLGVIGMAYYGETAKGDNLITYDYPENASAILVRGLGYPAASRKSMLKSYFPKLDATKQHLIGLAVGSVPYFDTDNDTGKTEQENFLIKRRIEIRLMQAGFASTMTYSGDGSDGVYDANKTENLCRRYGEEQNQK